MNEDYYEFEDELIELYPEECVKDLIKALHVMVNITLDDDRRKLFNPIIHEVYKRNGSQATTNDFCEFILSACQKGGPLDELNVNCNWDIRRKRNE